VPQADERLATAAKAAGIAVIVLDDPKIVPASAIAEGTDLIVAVAHAHARVTPEALARSRLGGIGYHPSLLPRYLGSRVTRLRSPLPGNLFDKNQAIGVSRA
jgi:methionyl-tRNA formyltransferase